MHSTASALFLLSSKFLNRQPFIYLVYGRGWSALLIVLPSSHI